MFLAYRLYVIMADTILLFNKGGIHGAYFWPNSKQFDLFFYSAAKDPSIIFMNM